MNNIHPLALNQQNLAGIVLLMVVTTVKGKIFVYCLYIPFY